MNSVSRKKSPPKVPTSSTTGIRSSNKKKTTVNTTTQKDVVNSLLSKTNKVNTTIIKKSHSLSKEGKDDKGKTKKNQDSYLLIRDLLGIENVNIFAVMDGHGENGDQISTHLKRFFQTQFQNNKSILKVKNTDEFYTLISAKNFDFITQIFKEAEKSLSKINIDFQFSGSTCVMVIQVNRKLICANVGDSRCIMVNGNNNTITALNRDHKPELPDEKERIISKGGEIEQFEENGVKEGPMRIWCKGKSYPGIAMSRSIGDQIASEIGVCCEPEIKQFEIKNDAKFMILASDGVWEFLDNEHVKDIVLPCYTRGSAESACTMLIKKATECWIQEDVCVDDITVIAVFF